MMTGLKHGNYTCALPNMVNEDLPGISLCLCRWRTEKPAGAKPGVL
jgi:hypothetical protein